MHISEMAGATSTPLLQVVKAGEDVQVKVMEINPDRRRISPTKTSAGETRGAKLDYPSLSGGGGEETDAE